MSRRHRVVTVNGATESDLDGTTKGVASVTLDSDHWSENSGSIRTKRRRRMRKRPASQMEWEVHLKDQSEVENSSENDSSSCNEGHDADDEQSDWPDYHPEKDDGKDYQTETEEEVVATIRVRNEIMETTPEPESANEAPPIKIARFAKPSLRCRDQANGNIPPPLKRRIERFLNDTVQGELSISHTYRIAAIRRLINRPEIEVIKRPKGNIVLRKPA